MVREQRETFLGRARERDRLLAFSCKERGCCPPCGGRRMADTAAHLVDWMLPEVPVRQWVLSLAFALHHRLAYDARLASAIPAVFVRTIFASLRRRARRQRGLARGQCGAVTFLQSFGGALDLNLHAHSLALDGVYAPDPEGQMRFHPPPHATASPRGRSLTCPNPGSRSRARCSPVLGARRPDIAPLRERMHVPSIEEASRSATRRSGRQATGTCRGRLV